MNGSETKRNGWLGALITRLRSAIGAAAQPKGEAIDFDGAEGLAVHVATKCVEELDSRFRDADLLPLNEAQVELVREEVAAVILGLMRRMAELVEQGDDLRRFAAEFDREADDPKADEQPAAR